MKTQWIVNNTVVIVVGSNGEMITVYKDSALNVYNALCNLFVGVSDPSEVSIDEVRKIIDKTTAVNNAQAEVDKRTKRINYVINNLNRYTGPYSIEYNADDDTIEVYKKGKLLRDFNTKIFEVYFKYLAKKKNRKKHPEIAFRSLANFITKLARNKLDSIANELFDYIQAADMLITPNGNILAYKSVRHTYRDWHTDTMDNSIGKVVTEAKEKVDTDCSRLCSSGLHFATYDYARSFNDHVSSQRLVILEVDPRDIMSIPCDKHNRAVKGRCWRYKVVGEVIDKKQFKEELMENRKFRLFAGDIADLDSVSIEMGKYEESATTDQDMAEKTIGEESKNSSENSKEKSVSIKGISHEKSTGKYRVDVRVNGKRVYVGRYPSYDQAKNALLVAKNAVSKASFANQAKKIIIDLRKAGKI